MSLINKAIIEQYVPVAVNLDAARIQLLADEQEVYRCTKLLGKELYNDIRNNPETEHNARLIFELIPVLVYRTMASYQLKGGVFNTAAGAFQKRSDASLPLSEEKDNRIYEDYRNMARFYESEVEAFLTANMLDYPLWRGIMKHPENKSFGISTTTPTNTI